jgi:hypothetical protein
MFARQQQAEAQAAKLIAPVQSTLTKMGSGDSTVPKTAQAHATAVRNEALSVLYSYQQSVGQMINQMWWDFFWAMVVKYRDIYK